MVILGKLRKVKIGPFEAEMSGEAIPKNVVDAIYTLIREMRQDFKALVIRVEKIEENIKQLRTDQLKQLLYDEDQEVEERIIAGLRYILGGGNGSVKRYLIKLVKENEQMYKTIVVALPHLRLLDADLGWN
jgi:hypothetical protein